MPTVGFSKEVKSLGFDDAVKLGEVSQEALQNVPCCDGGEVGRIGCVGVNKGVSAVRGGHGGIDWVAGVGVDAANQFFGVGETGADWLGEEEHIRDLIPCVGVEFRRQVRGDVAWPEFCTTSARALLIL